MLNLIRSKTKKSIVSLGIQAGMLGATGGAAVGAGYCAAASAEMGAAVNIIDCSAEKRSVSP